MQFTIAAPELLVQILHFLFDADVFAWKSTARWADAMAGPDNRGQVAILGGRFFGVWRHYQRPGAALFRRMLAGVRFVHNFGIARHQLAGHQST